MSTYIILVIFFSFIIHLINTLAYSVRIVGIRTGKIAVSFALFNIIALASRTANTIQAPLLVKTIENSIKTGESTSLISDFRFILLATTIGSIIGGFLIPTFQRIFSNVVKSFDVHRSVFRLLVHSFSKTGIKQFKDNLKVPSKNVVKQIKNIKDIPIKIVLLNTIVVAILTAGGLAAIYAGFLQPEFRATSTTLSSMITGIAVILLSVFIDPYLSIMTDDVIEGKKSEGHFRKCISFLVVGRILGTILAQVILLPASKLIAYVSVNIL